MRIFNISTTFCYNRVVTEQSLYSNKHNVTAKTSDLLLNISSRQAKKVLWENFTDTQKHFLKFFCHYMTKLPTSVAILPCSQPIS